MSIFPTIRHLDDLLPHIAHKPEIRVRKEPNDFTSVTYMIADSRTFDSQWTRECRGLLFDPNGNIHHRTLHKFFNVGERPDTQPHALNWNAVARVMDKQDGSMITASYYHGELLVKSKKSFESLVAVQARAFIEERTNYQSFIRYCTAAGLTPTFEWTTPRMRIVLPYTEDALTLLHIRNNVTGEYVDPASVAHGHGIPLVADMNLGTGDALLRTVQTMENAEGVVVQFASGDMVKLKSDWYCELHHAISFLRERDVVELVINEKIDDVKKHLTAAGVALDEVEAVEARAVARYTGIIDEVEREAGESLAQGLSFKEMALKYKTHKLFGLIMAKARGMDPEYKEYFLRHVLRQEYTLDQLGVEAPLGEGFALLGAAA